MTINPKDIHIATDGKVYSFSGFGGFMNCSICDNDTAVNEYDRQDRDIAVLIVGNSPEMRIVGWMPVAIAKKPRYRNTSQNNWSVPQINLQPIETLQRSNYAHSVI